MNKLASKIVRLAYYRPELRNDLIPLLRKIAEVLPSVASNSMYRSGPSTDPNDDDFSPFEQLSDEELAESLTEAVEIMKKQLSGNKRVFNQVFDEYNYIQDRIRGSSKTEVDNLRAFPIAEYFSERLGAFGWDKLETTFKDAIPYIGFSTLEQIFQDDGWVYDSDGRIGVPRKQKTIKLVSGWKPSRGPNAQVYYID